MGGAAVRLSKVTIQNFGPIESFVTTFDPQLTVVQGASGAGKTQLIEGLYGALTGNLAGLRLHSGGKPSLVVVLTEHPSGLTTFSLGATENDDQATTVTRSVIFEPTMSPDPPSLENDRMHVALLSGEIDQLKEPIPARSLERLTDLGVTQGTIAALQRSNDEVQLLAYSERFALTLTRDFDALGSADPAPFIMLDSPLGRMSEDKLHWVVEIIHAFARHAQMLVTLTPFEASSYAQVTGVEAASLLPMPTPHRSMLGGR